MNSGEWIVLGLTALAVGYLFREEVLHRARVKAGANVPGFMRRILPSGSGGVPEFLKKIPKVAWWWIVLVPIAAAGLYYVGFFRLMPEADVVTRIFVIAIIVVIAIVIDSSTKSSPSLTLKVAK